MRAALRAIKLGLLSAGILSSRRAGIAVAENGSGGRPGRVYSRHPGSFPVVVLHGLTAAGHDDRRLVRFARDLALCGFEARTPRLEGLASFDLDPRDLDGIAEEILAASRGPRSVGLIGFSLGGSYALLASARPDAAATVRWVLAAGAYWSLEALIDRAFARGSADPYAVLAMGVRAADLLPLAPEEGRLYESIMAGYCAREGAFPADERALMGKIVALPEQEAVAAFWRRRVPSLRALDPSAPDALAGLAAQVFLLHGARDDVVPAEDAVRLAGALAAAGKRPLTCLNRGSGHVDFGASIRTGLARMIVRLMRLSAMD